MGPDLLISFVAFSEDENLTRAAQRLFVSQSGLSRRLAALEGALGCPLLIRTRSSARLSAAGRDFLPHARAILEAISVGLEAMQEGWEPDLHSVPLKD